MTNRITNEQNRLADGAAGRGSGSQPGTDADLADAIDDAATALAGIAEALEWRTATDPDPLLELLAESATTRADALRDALG